MAGSRAFRRQAVAQDRNRGCSAICAESVEATDVVYAGWLLRLIPESQECHFTADDTHMTETGFCESQERSRANYLSKHLIAALKGSKWEHSAGWHLYRHTFASRLLANGYSKMDVKELIGWCSDEMAQRYQHQTLERKAAIINSLT